MSTTQVSQSSEQDIQMMEESYKAANPKNIKSTIIKTIVVLIAVFSLLSPIYVAIFGSSYLNQKPPVFWGMNVGTHTPTAASSTKSSPVASSFGGC